MVFPALPDRSLAALGRTEGDPETLALLVRDQDTRRLLTLRALLDAVDGADATVLTAGARDRLREHWHLLEEADRAVPPGDRGNPAPAHATTPARARLLHPLVGPWARQCLRGLAPQAGPPTDRRVHDLERYLAHLGALAAAAAARAGIPFALRLTARDGLLVLPSLGALRTAGPGEVPVDVVGAGNLLTLRQKGAADAVVQLEDGIGAWSAAPGWTPAYALPGLLPEGPPMPLDDLDPYRTGPGDSRHHELSGPTVLDEAGRKRWLQAWSGTADMLRLGGEHRVTEAVALLRCLVPLAEPPRSGPDAEGVGSCSGTRREAFGALLSSTPPTPATFAATIVHELQHTKLSALSDLLELHHAGPRQRHFAPWRPDPRPYDGLLQGVYSHLALADFFQRCALRAERPAHRETAWSQHARYRAQVAAALPALVGSEELTARGRRFVDHLVVTHERMAEFPAPPGHTARAEASVEEARDLWTRRHGPAVRHPEE
ncbi:aKG-HExxH-type peptide beta-hydroxylase [Streptomyces fuscichromogenes]|uniref:aKG-HExxH-type peptide beta-hydroxylase n=1 Tax=Streptomyces fuscichromogenes TaxID=1324013 RepID=UPI003809DC49